MIEGIFAAVCAGLAAAMIWAAAHLQEPFYLCVAVFSAAFWGSLAAFCVWGKISERAARSDLPRPTIIWRR